MEKQLTESIEKRKNINHKILKFGCLPIILIFVLTIIISIFSDDKNSKKKNIEEKNIEIITSKIESNDEKLKEQLIREIEFINKGIDFSNYRDEIQSIQMEIILFGAWAKNIEEAKSSDNDEIKKLGEKLEIKVKNIQIKEFPILRKSYCKAIYQKLWIENIETSILGKGNKTIQFTGGIFANNKNKQETQNTLSDILRQFRFKRVNYKWYEYDDDFTYYEIDTPNDDELVTFN
jgi:hypothetical protein